MNTAECLVIGGGLAGSMAALRLAAAGREVVLVEKERSAHDKVCGEFLSAEAIGYLRQAGVDPMSLGAAPIQTLRFSVGKSIAETELPFAALSLSRRVLDEALLARASEAGATVLRGAAVNKLARDGAQWRAATADGKTLQTRAVFLATGKHDLRGWQRIESGAVLQNDLVGFKLHWRLVSSETARLRGCMELFLFRGGYGGLALVENGVANLCLVVRKKVLRTLGGWPELLQKIRSENALLEQRLGGAEPLWERPLAISSIPYGYLAAQRDGVWRLGDQAAVIPSFTGDGMSIALHSGALAAEMYLAGQGADAYQMQLSASLRSGMRVATLLSRAAVHPLAHILGPAVLRGFPRGMRWIAESTRIPETALLLR